MGGKHSKKKAKDNKLEVLVGKTTHRITASPNTPVDSIFDEIRKKTDVDVVILKCFEIFIKPGMKNGDQPTRLIDLGINPFRSRLSAVWPTSHSQKIEFTTDKDKPCVISYEDDDNKPRALMPCKCAITKESLYKHCKTEVFDEYKYRHQIKCPKCDAVWEWSLIKQVCKFTDEEFKDLTEGISENYLSKNKHNYFECPFCMTLYVRPNDDIVIVKCQICSKKRGRDFKFCRKCLKETKGTGNICDNKYCNNFDERLKYLKKCAETSIGGVKCPAARLCPRCDAVIEHKEKCKRVSCPCCSHKFCFICLQSLNSTSSLRDKHKDCKVAPVQTHLANK